MIYHPTQNVKRITLTEEGKVTARKLTSCPVPLEDAFIGQEGVYLIFGVQDKMYHHVDSPMEIMELSTTLGDQIPESDITIGVGKRLIVMRDKHGYCGLQAIRWNREWMGML